MIKIGGEAKVGYMGGSAWNGCNSDGWKSYAEINKIVKKEFKDKYKGIKVSCRGSSFSGGQECNGMITLNINDAICTYEEFVENAKNKNYQPWVSTWYYINGDAVWGENIDFDTRLKATYDNYVDMIKKEWGIRMNNIGELDECILKPKAIKMIKDLNAMYDSFQRYDINSMVDYFDTNFYKEVSLKCIDETQCA